MAGTAVAAILDLRPGSVSSNESLAFWFSLAQGLTFFSIASLLDKAAFRSSERGRGFQYLVLAFEIAAFAVPFCIIWRLLR
jgi:hypothetical protein